jgi:ABC-2 type transport system ATP-binding protein
VYLEGRDVTDDVSLASGCLAVMPQGNALDPLLNVRDNLVFYCRLIGMVRPRIRAAVDAVAEQFGLTSFMSRSVYAISGGQFRRTQLARTFLGQPRCILLDEPTLGIDIQGKTEVWAIIRECARQDNRTVFIASNDITEVETVCDRIAFLDDGRLLRVGTRDELTGTSLIELQCQLQTDFQPEGLATPVSVTLEQMASRMVALRFSAYDRAVVELLGAIADRHGLAQVTEQRGSLVDLFKKIGGQPS